MRKVHVAAGFLLFAVFLVTGGFMKWEMLQGEALDPLYRSVHRSRHIYILFTALLNTLAGFAWSRADGWRMTLRWISSVFILISGALMPIAFIVEPGLHKIAAPVTFYGVVSALTGVGLLVITHVPGRRRTIHPSGLTIRPYAERDREEVVRLWTRSELVVPANDPIRDIAEKVRFQPGLFFVGLVSQRIVATVMAGYEGHRGWIHYLAVDPDHRKRGYAKAMMEIASDTLKRLGCQKINLQIREGNTDVVEFYRKIGFSVEPRVQMGRRL